jgi:phosphopantetheinyl transferase (holo-ACP synthase)
MYYIGNDIVDQDVSGTKHTDQRFMQRVFTENERRLILESSLPEIVLWCLWAGKESAFKIVSKLAGPSVFAHRRFQNRCFEYSLKNDTDVIARGQMEYQNNRLDVFYFGNVSVVHVFAHLPVEQSDTKFRAYTDYTLFQKSSEDWRDLFTEAEKKSIRFPEAAGVRQHCKRAIAEKTGIGIQRLQIIRPSKQNIPYPPYLLIDGKPCEIDISLAHHGKWLAWAFTVPG